MSLKDYALINLIDNLFTGDIVKRVENQPISVTPNYSWVVVVNSGAGQEPAHEPRTQSLKPALNQDGTASWVVSTKTQDEIEEYDRQQMPLISVTGFQFTAALAVMGYLSSVNTELAQPGNELLKIAFEKAQEIHSNDKRVIDMSARLNIPIYPVFEVASGIV